MASIAKFAVQIIAKTSKFNKGMDKSRQKLKGFGAGVAKVASKVGGMAKVMVAAAAVAFVAMVRSTLSAVDATAKLAASLGLAVEHLSALQFAASISGVEVEKLGNIFRNMEKAIADANLAVPLTTAVRAFDALGIEAKELIDLSPEEAFFRLADAISRTDNQMRKLGAVSDIFGKRLSTGVIELTKDGAAGLRALIEEARAFGVVISNLEAEKIQQVNDSLVDAGSVSKGFFKTLTAEGAPAMTALIDKFTEWAKAAETGTTIAVLFGKVFTFVINAVAAEWDVLTIIIKGTFGVLAKALSVVARGVEKLIGLMSKIPGLGFLKGIEEGAKNTADFLNDLGTNLFTEVSETKFGLDIEKILKDAEEKAEARKRQLEKSRGTGGLTDTAAGRGGRGGTFGAGHSELQAAGIGGIKEIAQQTLEATRQVERNTRDIVQKIQLI